MDSDSSSLLPLIIFIASVSIFAVASLTETCISSVRRERVQRLASQNEPGSSSLDKLHSLPMGPVSAPSLIKYIGFSAALISAIALIVSVTGSNWQLITLGSLLNVILLGMAFGLMRAIGSAYGENLALKFAPFVRALSWITYPILMAGSVIAYKILRISPPGANGTDETTAPVEISIPLQSAGEPLDEREVRMIHGVVQLDDTIAREIMIPRVDMVVAEISISIMELAEHMVTNSHSRVPIYREDLDHIEGVAYARDILQHLTNNEGHSDLKVESIIREPLFIPESKTLEELLAEFQQKRVHMAIVVDEYGGVSGLVTIEDLLEEIVGDILDEFDINEPEVIVVSETEYLMDARVGIDDLNELLSTSVESDGFDTLGGFVYERLGKIPSPGDSLDYNGLTVEVISTAGRRLKRLRVQKKEIETPCEQMG